MPKLWSETVDSHRHEVRNAILESTAALAASRGLFNVTMTEIASDVGISRATLYKYFPGVEQILDAWHERHIAAHLDELNADAAEDRPAFDRFATVLTSYARTMQRRSEHSAGNHGTELTSFLHRPDGTAGPASVQIHELAKHLIAEAAHDGAVRSDATPDELAYYCLHALGAAVHLTSDAAIERLVELVLSGVRS